MSAAKELPQSDQTAQWKYAGIHVDCLLGYIQFILIMHVQVQNNEKHFSI